MRGMQKVLLIGLSGALCSVASAQLSFSNETTSCELFETPGVIAAHDLSELDPNFDKMNSGGAIGDFNNDGFPDIFYVRAEGGADMLFINDGDGTFTNQAAAWGVDATHLGNGAAAGDFNNDGHLDLFVTSYGPVGSGGLVGQHRLYRNNGNSTFTEMGALAGVNFTTTTNYSGTAGAFGDYDRDGDLDLFIGSWGQTDRRGTLYRNNGDETFTDVTVAAGVLDPAVYSFAPRFVDMTGDGWPELIMAADFNTSRYYVNNCDGTFSDETVAVGAIIDMNGMGSTVGDFNGDGLMDWYVSSIHQDPGDDPRFSGNVLYQNQGDGTYADVSMPAGVNNGGWGWGTVAVDLDHDADLDIVEVNGWTPTPAYEFENAKVFMNQGDTGGFGHPIFTEEAVSLGMDYLLQGRGLGAIDFDLDGDQDFVMFTNRDEIRLYRNDLTPGTGGWLRVVLDTSTDNFQTPNGMGSMVFVTIGGVTQMRSIDGGSNYATQSELSAHFGLGAAATIDEVRVEWADGRVTTQTNVAANQHLTIQSPKTGDVNGDGLVGAADMALALGSWGPVHAQPTDVNRDGNVGAADIALLLGNWDVTP